MKDSKPLYAFPNQLTKAIEHQLMLMALMNWVKGRVFESCLDSDDSFQQKIPCSGLRKNALKSKYVADIWNAGVWKTKDLK